MTRHLTVLDIIIIIVLIIVAAIIISLLSPLVIVIVILLLDILFTDGIKVEAHYNHQDMITRKEKTVRSVIKAIINQTETNLFKSPAE